MLLDHDDFPIEAELGAGASAVVYLVIWKETQVAMKRIFLNSESEEDNDLFRQEAKLMNILRHRNIVLFMGAFISPSRVTILTEFCSRGSLFDVSPLSHLPLRLLVLMFLFKLVLIKPVLIVLI